MTRLLSFVAPLEQVLEILNTELTSLIALAVAFGGAVNIIIGLQVGPLAKSIEDLKADMVKSNADMVKSNGDLKADVKDLKTGLVVFAFLSTATFVAAELLERP